MNETPHLTPGQVIDLFRAKFGDGLLDARVTERGEGVKKTKSTDIWLRVRRDLFRPAVEELIHVRFPRLAVIAGNDLGAGIELLYIFSLFYGRKFGEYVVTIGVLLPKDDLTIPTITDLIPGALFSEREKQEFFGIAVTGIPDGRRLFLPDDFPDGVYPWRKDETGVPPDMVKNLWTVDRPTNRPAPPVPEKIPEETGEKKGGEPV